MNMSRQAIRLVAEILSTQEVDMEVLCESMDLEMDDLKALMGRISDKWDQIMLGEMSSLNLTVKGPDYVLGLVSPPDNMLRNNPNDPIYWRQVMQDLWDQWRQEEPHPDTDAEFIDWLCEKHGFSDKYGMFVDVR